MCVYVPVFNHLPKNPTLPLLNAYLDTWREQKNLDFSILKGKIFLLLDILMQIMQVTR